MKVFAAIWNSDEEKKLNCFSVNHEIEGMVYFVQENEFEDVKVSYQFRNIPKKDRTKVSKHGFHIHEKALDSVVHRNTSPENPCNSLCGHFNPTNTVHGYHYGDLCFNIRVDPQGKSEGWFTSQHLNLYTKDPKFSIKNRSIVIHEDRDNKGLANGHQDDESLKTGRAGARIGCANIFEIN